MSTFERLLRNFCLSVTVYYKSSVFSRVKGVQGRMMNRERLVKYPAEFEFLAVRASNIELFDAFFPIGGSRTSNCAERITGSRKRNGISGLGTGLTHCSEAQLHPNIPRSARAGWKRVRNAEIAECRNINFFVEKILNPQRQDGLPLRKPHIL